MSATSDLKMADYDIPVYPGTMRYNPQVKDHGIIIGCLVFHGLLMPNPVEVQPPGDYRLFIVLRVVTSRDHIPSASLDNEPLDLVYNPVRELGKAQIAQRTHR